MKNKIFKNSTKFNGNLMGTLWEPCGNLMGALSNANETHVKTKCRITELQNCTSAHLHICKTEKAKFADFADFANFATSYFARVAAVLLMILTLGVGNAWADCGFNTSADNGCYFCYAKDNGGNNCGAVSTTSYDLGVVTDNVKITSLYLKAWDNGGSSRYLNAGQFCYKIDDGENVKKGLSCSWVLGNKNGNNYEVNAASFNQTIISANEYSGNHTMKFWLELVHYENSSIAYIAYLSNNSNNYTMTYTILPPAVTNFAVSHSDDNVISGTGTESDPYIITNGGSLKLTATSDKAHTDANSHRNYKFGSDAYSITNTKTISSITSTDKQSIVVNARCINNTALLNGAESSTTIYYKAAAPGWVMYKNDNTPVGTFVLNAGVYTLSNVNLVATEIYYYKYGDTQYYTGGENITTGFIGLVEGDGRQTWSANSGQTAKYSLTIKDEGGWKIKADATNYTFTSGSTWYFDFRGVDCSGNKGGLNWPNATGGANWDENGCGSVKSVTFSQDVLVTLGQGWNSIKTKRGGDAAVTLPSTAPAPGQNCLIISSDGLTATWGTYSDYTIPSILKITGELSEGWDRCTDTEKNDNVFTYTSGSKAAGTYLFCFKNSECSGVLLKPDTPGQNVSMTKGDGVTTHTNQGGEYNNFKIITSQTGQIRITVTYDDVNKRTTVHAEVLSAQYTGLSVARNIDAAAGEPTISATSVNQGSSVNVVAQDANEGYQWYRWVSSNGTFGTATDKSTTFTPSANNAVARADYKIRVRYDLQGHGDPIAAVFVEKDAKTTAPAAPEVSGYSFGGWYKEAGCTNAWNFETEQVTTPTTLYAKWEATCTDPTISWTTEARSKHFVGTTFNCVAASAAGTVSYSSTNTEVATVNASTGAISFIKAGNVQIIASVTGDGSTYCATQANCTTLIEVKDLYVRNEWTSWTNAKMTKESDNVLSLSLSSPFELNAGRDEFIIVSDATGDSNKEFDHSNTTMDGTSIVSNGDDVTYKNFKFGMAHGSYTNVKILLTIDPSTGHGSIRATYDGGCSPTGWYLERGSVETIELTYVSGTTYRVENWEVVNDWNYLHVTDGCADYGPAVSNQQVANNTAYTCTGNSNDFHIGDYGGKTVTITFDSSTRQFTLSYSAPEVNYYWIAGNGAEASSGNKMTKVSEGVYRITMNTTNNQYFHLGDGTHKYWPNSSNIPVNVGNTYSVATDGATYAWQYVGSTQEVTYTFNTSTMKLSLEGPVATPDYYVYLGQSIALPSGEYTFNSADAANVPAKYYDNKSQSTQTYSATDAVSLDGNVLTGNKLGLYRVVKDGTTPYMVAVYRYYAKYPWGACSNTPADDYNKTWKWQALDYVDDKHMSVVGLYSYAVDNHANIGWDFYYDWNGLYRFDGDGTSTLYPGKDELDRQGYWVDNTTEALNGGSKYLSAGPSPAGISCDDGDYIKLTYNSTVSACGTTAPNTGGSFTQEKYEPENYIPLNYGVYPAESGEVTHDAAANSVPAGTKVTFTAMPSDENLFTFEGWYSDATCETKITTGVDENRYQITVPSGIESVNAYAKFTPKNFTITVTGSNYTLNNFADAGAYAYTSVVGFTILPAVGYKITNVTITQTGSTLSKNIDGKNYAITGTMPAEDVTITVTTEEGVDSGWYLMGKDFGGWGGSNFGDLISHPEYYMQLDRGYRGIPGYYCTNVNLIAKDNDDGDHYFKVFRNNGNSTTTRFTSLDNNNDCSLAMNTMYSMESNDSKSMYVTENKKGVCVVVKAHPTAPQIMIEDPAKTYHTVTVTGAESFGTYTLTTVATNNSFVPAGTEATMFVSGEQYKVTITTANNLVGKPSATLNGTPIDPSSWVQDGVNPLKYTYTGTMGDENVTIAVTYNPTKDYEFEILGEGLRVINNETNPAVVGEEIRFHYHDWVNFNGTPGFQFWIKRPGEEWTNPGNAIMNLDTYGDEILFKAIASDDGFNSVRVEKVCTLRVAQPELTLSVAPDKIYQNTTVSLIPVITKTKSTSNLMICYSYTSSQSGANETFYEGSPVTTKPGVEGSYTIHGILKYGTECATSRELNNADVSFTVLPNYITLHFSGGNNVGNTITLTAETNLDENVRYTFSVRTPGQGVEQATQIGDVNGTATRDYTFATAGTYYFKVQAVDDNSNNVATEWIAYDVQASNYFLRYSFKKSDNSRERNNVPMEYNDLDGTYYYYSTSVHYNSYSWYCPISSYDANWDSGGGRYAAITKYGSADDTYIDNNSGKGNNDSKWYDVKNDEGIGNDVTVIFHYSPVKDKVWITGAKTLYRVKSEGVNGTFYSNAVAGANEEISFYASTDANLSWEKSDNGLDGWTNYGAITTTADADGIYTSTPTAINNNDANTLSLAPYTGDLHVYNGSLSGNGKLVQFTTTTYYDHYYVEYMAMGKNVGATMGNEINNCIAAILPQYVLPQNASPELSGANVRYEYKAQTNAFTRTLIGGSSTDNFIRIYGDNISEDGNISFTKQSAKKLSDGSNWVYTVNVIAKTPGATSVKAKLMATYNGTTRWILSKSGTESAADAAVELLGVQASAGKYTMDIIYDYKTNRLIAGWINGEVDDNQTITVDGDMLVWRTENAQDDGGSWDKDTQSGIATVSMGTNSVVLGIKTITTVLQMRRDKLYNNSKAWVNDNYHFHWISLPYDCRVSDIFGLNMDDYGTKWYVEEYRGDMRAYFSWVDFIPTFWMIMEPTDVMKANQGYVVYVSPEYNDFVQIGDVSQLFLYFPSHSDGTFSLRNGSDIQTVVPEHRCEVTSPVDRTKDDSNWNVIGVPAYMSATVVQDPTPAVESFFSWNSRDHYKPRRFEEKVFTPTYSYMVQYAGTLTWTAFAEIEHISAVAARMGMENHPTSRFTLQMLDMDGEFVDQTLVTLKESGTDDYQMGQDLLKIFVSGNSQIYTIGGGERELATNVVSDTTTRIALATSLKQDECYTLHMDIREEQAVVPYVYDALTNIYTNLETDDYFFSGDTGKQNNRFQLVFRARVPEIATSMDNLSSADSEFMVRVVDGKIVIEGAENGNHDVFMYDAAGRLLHASTTAGGNAIDLPSANGVYFVRCGSQVAKIIVR